MHRNAPIIISSIISMISMYTLTYDGEMDDTKIKAEIEI